AGMRFYHHHWLDGTATNWQNHHLRASASFTVELPAGSLAPQQVRRQVRAVLTLAAALRGPPHQSHPVAFGGDRRRRTRPVSLPRLTQLRGAAIKGQLANGCVTITRASSTHVVLFRTPLWSG